MSTFISIGNAKQPFSRFFEMIDNVEEQLPSPITVQYGHTPYENNKMEVVDFVDMEEFSERISQAKLIILHAGAGSVIHAISAGQKPIIIPRESQYGEHVDDHQLEFSVKLASLGKVFVSRNTSELQESITSALNETTSISSPHELPEAFDKIKTVFDKYENIFG